VPKRGGYSRSTNDEWLKTTRGPYAVYRCELIMCRQRYAEASREAAAALEPSPLESDYMPTRPAPTITRTEGQGSGQGKRSFRP
jgi:hypothetical protein